ncbi:MAG: copper resistance protein CopC [Chloroflexia bacterium]
MFIYRSPIHELVGATPTAFLRALRLALLLLLAALVATATPETALGHASVVRTLPEQDSATPSSPPRIRIWFAERIEPRFSSIELTDAGGGVVATSDFRIEGADGRSADVALPSLPDGSYIVRWRNVSTVDGHSLAGAFAFSVGDAPPPTGALAIAPTNEATNSGPLLPSALVRALNYLLIAVVVGALAFRPLVLIPVLGLYERRRRPSGDHGADETRPSDGRGGGRRDGRRSSKRRGACWGARCTTAAALDRLASASSSWCYGRQSRCSPSAGSRHWCCRRSWSPDGRCPARSGSRCSGCCPLATGESGC